MGPTNTIKDIIEAKNNYGFSGIPITENGHMGGKLEGLVTQRDIDMIQEDVNKNKPVSEVLKLSQNVYENPLFIWGIQSVIKSD